MEYEKIDISAIEKVGVIDFSKMQKEAFIDVNEKIPYPPVALSIGTQQTGQETYPIPFGTYGNFSCIVGASKAKKTFIKSLILASYIGGKSSNYASNIKSHIVGNKFVLDFDTEQSEFHSQLVFKRIPKLVGENYDYYKPYYLRKYDFKERLQFIEYMILESEYRDNIGMVNIDGFADLVKDVNDLESCNALVQSMLKWTDISNCHLTGILHANFGSSKPTGHLGSAILKKSETVAMLNVDETDKNYTNVSFPYTRSFGIDDFKFTIDNNGLPIIEDGLPLDDGISF